MKTLKTMVIAASLAMAPGAAFAQAAPGATGEVPAAATPAGVAPLPTAAEQAPAVAAAKTPDIVHVAPTAGVGMPVDGKIGLQPQFTDIGREAAWFHDSVLMPVITVITILVLVLLLWVVVRFNRAANREPSRTSHNTVIEIVWTLAPVLVLLAIAVPSIKLLARQYDPGKPDMTIKVIGNQWYWTYQYPDNGNIELVSNMLKEKGETTGKERARTDADGPRMLAVDERLVLPAGKVIKVITTSNDVIHSFAVPAFWTKMDAIPGRLNETWFKVDRPGVYYGECSELCGDRHAFMPIAVEIVPPAQFAQWVLSKGGTMPAAGRPGPATATSPVSSPAAGTPNGAPTVIPTTPTENATGIQKPVPARATANRAGTI